MTDTNDSDVPPDPDATPDAEDAGPQDEGSRQADWYARRWSTLCEVLGTTDPDEVVPRVRTLQNQLGKLDRRARSAGEGLITVGEVEEALQEMHEKIQGLKARNDSLVEQMADESETTAEQVRIAQDVADVLGASRLEDAPERARALRKRLETLREEAERDTPGTEGTDAPGGDADAERLREERDRLAEERDRLADTVDTLNEDYDALDEEREALRVERNQLQDRHDELREQHDALRDDHEAVKRQRDDLEERLGDATRERDRLDEEVDRLQRENDRLSDEVGRLEGVVERLEGEVDRLEDEVGRLEDERDRVQERLEAAKEAAPDTSALEAASTIRTALGVESPDDAHRLADRVRSLHDRVQSVVADHDTLDTATGVSTSAPLSDLVGDLADQVDSLDDRLSSAADVMAALGLSSPDEAQALEATLRRIGQRVESMVRREDVVLDAEPVEGAASAIEVAKRTEISLEQADRALGPDPGALPAEVGDILGIGSVEEAREFSDLIQEMTGRLETLSAEHAKLEEAGLTVDEALSMIDNMEDQLSRTYDETDEEAADDTIWGGPSDADGASGPNEPDEPDRADGVFGGLPDDRAPSSSTPNGGPPDGAPPDGGEGTGDEEADADARVAELLGVSTPEEAEELNDLVRSMAGQLQDLTREHQRLVDVGMTVDQILNLVDSMEEQLVALYEERDTGGAGSASDADALEELDEVLGLGVAEETATADAYAERAAGDLHDLLAETEEVLGDAPDSVAGLIDRVEAEVERLRRDRGDLEEAARHLSDIEEVLGIASREEAEELAALARNMEVQLNDLYEDKEKLEAVGLSTIDDAIAMIDSMESQLVELYENEQAVQERETLRLDADQDTFQQLEALYAERERLERELGVSSADEIIEMVEGMATQLDELYTGRDVTAEPEDGRPPRAGAASLSGAASARAEGEGDGPPPSAAGAETRPTDAAPSQDPGSAASAAAAGPGAALMIESMQEQLQALYREKRTLTQHGFNDAKEAVSRLHALEDRVETLDARSSACEERLGRVADAVGAAGPDEAVSAVESLAGAEGGSAGAPPASSGADPDAAPGSSGAEGPGDEPPEALVVDDAPPALADQTLQALEQMSTEDMNAMDVAVFCLDDAGQVRAANAAAGRLPGVAPGSTEALVGENFFTGLFPRTDDPVVRGRFDEGVRRGAMDARFPFTFVGPDAATVCTVHLHRKPEAGVNWVIVRPM
jgi:photoactive yellow protein